MKRVKYYIISFDSMNKYVARFVTLIGILSFCLSSLAQIKTVEKIKKEKIILPYDSTRNCLEKREIEQYIGQAFYLPKTTMEIKNGYRCFKKDLKGKTYKPIDRSSFSKTKYEAIAGKYFDVISIERNTRAYINDVYIHLKETETGEELYYDFGKDSFPFVVLGYYEKNKKNLIGRIFFLDFGRSPKRCVDYYIEEGHTYSEVLKFEDNSTQIYGEYLLAEDRGGRYAVEKLREIERIEKQYGKLRLGIDENVCEIICGVPIKKNISEGEWGQHEQWVYDDKYIYIENGKVTSIQYEKR